MVTTELVRRTSNQQGLPVPFLNLSLLISSQGQTQDIMAELVESLQDSYLSTLNISTSEHLKLYNKAIVGLPESDRYDLTRSKWTKFYQELEDDVSKF